MLDRPRIRPENAQMNENESTILLNVLLSLWESALTREETLKLILRDVAPDWPHRYRDYWNDAEALEAVMKTTAKMRGIVKAALQGELSASQLQQAALELQRKPNLP
jgi:hypothetical protein